MRQVVITETVNVDVVVDVICQTLPVEYHDSVVAAVMGAMFDAKTKRKIRNREMLTRFFNGERQAALCREYRISRMQFNRELRKHYVAAKVAAASRRNL